eukprot:CAMPEP_0197518240 /NCGR_PEP_ID=MMETSP1318-20131121/3380_1 /TAXON_ID=552666 /ORGANISM="Partenskyella glossopodia, Strain RCC365" /LENGTH=656 /DNA_ID=CAMNT_0043068413 /DNA_START=324 /DNA_END=2294 /DNA_ORIENTATION=+
MTDITHNDNKPKPEPEPEAEAAPKPKPKPKLKQKQGAAPKPKPKPKASGAGSNSDEKSHSHARHYSSQTPTTMMGWGPSLDSPGGGPGRKTRKPRKKKSPPKSPTWHQRASTMPLRPNPVKRASDYDLYRAQNFERRDNFQEPPDMRPSDASDSTTSSMHYNISILAKKSLAGKRMSLCVGDLSQQRRVVLGSAASTVGQYGRRHRAMNSITRNLLVDLDKIEKTAGMVKVRRRNSITLGELAEARDLKLEESRNGVIHSSLMHQEWRRKRFQALYQAMKRRKMLMRLQRARPVPREVELEEEKDERERSRSRSRSRGRRETSGDISAAQQQRLSGTAEALLRKIKNFEHKKMGLRTITLDQMSRLSSGTQHEQDNIYVLNTGPAKVLLEAKKVKLADYTQDQDQDRQSNGGPYNGNGFVFLTRHGEREDHVNPKWYLNAENVFDPPLSLRGIAQAAELGERLLSENITHIIASPFTRTIQTAIEVAKKLGLKVHIDHGLAEHMETKQFRNTCKRLQLDPYSFQVQINTHQELLGRYPDHICPDLALPEIKLNKWPASFPEEEEQLFDRTNNTVKHMGLFAFEHKANVLLVSHQTPVEYMAFELCSEAEDKFVSVCCLTKAAPRKQNPKKKGWKLIFQHDDSFLSEPECGDGGGGR